MCTDSEYCTASACQCRPGLVRSAGGQCIDPNSNPTACGTAATVCANPTRDCQAGTCVAACGAGFDTCGNSCVHFATDPLNCGACGQPCANDEICDQGTCQQYGSALGCTTCPCTTCKTGEQCCGFPGVPSYLVCVMAATCP